MGRVGYGPSLSLAEFVMGRDVQLPSGKSRKPVIKIIMITSCHDLQYSGSCMLIVSLFSVIECLYLAYRLAPLVRSQFVLKSIRTHFGQFVLSFRSIRTHLIKFSQQ